MSVTCTVHLVSIPSDSSFFLMIFVCNTNCHDNFLFSIFKDSSPTPEPSILLDPIPAPEGTPWPELPTEQHVSVEQRARFVSSLVQVLLIMIIEEHHRNEPRMEMFQTY